MRLMISLSEGDLENESRTNFHTITYSKNESNRVFFKFDNIIVRMTGTSVKVLTKLERSLPPKPHPLDTT